MPTPAQCSCDVDYRRFGAGVPKKPTKVKYIKSFCWRARLPLMAKRIVIGSARHFHPPAWPRSSHVPHGWLRNAGRDQRDSTAEQAAGALRAKFMIQFIFARSVRMSSKEKYWLLVCRQRVWLRLSINRRAVMRSWYHESRNDSLQPVLARLTSCPASVASRDDRKSRGIGVLSRRVFLRCA